ncbi:MAG TPA: PTS sugar transporter subunit IIA [Xanthobacteraceae bacterium]|nr:PTS sugar transporter subunit IIA [Xanthobacteraceae bacterium]
MKIADLLSPNNATIDIAAADKQKVMQTLAQRAGAIVAVLPDHILAELCKREELGSTGVGGGVALPHARFEELAEPIGLLLRLRKPIDFDAVDGEPVDIVFLLLLPETGEGKQLGALALISRKLRDPKITTALREARDGREMYRALAVE